jgi:hypothetical protein
MAGSLACRHARVDQVMDFYAAGAAQTLRTPAWSAI